MKLNHITYIAAAAAIFSLSSCKDFLAVEPQGTPTTEHYFESDRQSLDAVKNLYYKMTDQNDNLFGRELFWEQNGSGDLVFGKSRDFPTVASRNYTGNESPLHDCYKNLYIGIARSNWVVNGLLTKRKSTELTEIESRSLGEAYFMRAFFHLYAAYRYGLGEQGVPFIKYEDCGGTYDNEIPPQQKSVCDNYRMIIEDLTAAEELLPKFESYDAENRGRAHKAAACAYRAKTYAYWAMWDPEKWKDVIIEVNKLESEYGRGLASTYEELFTHEVEKFWSKEYIWGITSRGGTSYGGCELPGVMWENKGWGKFNGWGQNKPTLGIYNEMAKDNVNGTKNYRLAYSILEYGDRFHYFGSDMEFFSVSDYEAGFSVFKFQHAATVGDNPLTEGLISTNANFPTFTINFPLLRMADCILLRAEAYLATNEPGKAATDINAIRKRAQVTPIGASATWTDLYHERRCELAFEYSDHLFDLKRWAVSNVDEIKKLAIAELEGVQMVRKYANRKDPHSSYTKAEYSDGSTHHIAWDRKQLVFPYPSEQINKSNGALKQNPGY